MQPIIFCLGYQDIMKSIILCLACTILMQANAADPGLLAPKRRTPTLQFAPTKTSQPKCVVTPQRRYCAYRTLYPAATRNLNYIINMTSCSTGFGYSAPVFGGARPDANAYYINGVRVMSNFGFSF